MTVRRPRCQEGSAATEAVLVTPALLFLVMLVIQFGLWYHAQHVVRAAAEEGVRVARSEQSSAEAGERTVESFLAQVGPRIVIEPVVVVERTADEVTVAVSGRVVSVVPGFSLPLEATAVSPVERFRASR